jgi:hypothetical protein
MKITGFFIAQLLFALVGEVKLKLSMLHCESMATCQSRNCFHEREMVSERVNYLNYE